MPDATELGTRRTSGWQAVERFLDQQLRVCFSHQDATGALPETFPGAGPGCWTSAEVHGALATQGAEGRCPAGVFDSLEAYLLDACGRHEGQGLPYYVCADGERTLSRPVVDASAAFATGLAAARRQPEVAAAIRSWLAQVQQPSGGWGIAAGEGERLYSTGYAILALAGTEHDDAAQAGRHWLRRQAVAQGDRVWWPCRPGLTSPSPLSTALAVGALELADDDPLADRVARYLVDAVESHRLVEEDEFPTRAGLKMTFTYAPRLACLAALLRLSRPDAGGAGPRSDTSLMEERALRALARHVYLLLRHDQPVVDLEPLRLWHFLDLFWGLGNVRRELDAVDGRRARFDALFEAYRLALARRLAVETAPPPLASVCQALWPADPLSADQLGNLLAATETMCRLVRARMAGIVLADLTRAGKAHEAAAAPAKGARTVLWQLRKDAERSTELLQGPPGAAARRFMAAVTRQAGMLNGWIDRRNNVHRESANASGRRLACAEWSEHVTDALDAFPELYEPPLVTIEDVALPSGAPGYRYLLHAWRGVAGPAAERLVEGTRRLHDRDRVEALGQASGSGHLEIRWVYTGALDDGLAGLLPLTPFVVRAACPRCREAHFFLLEGGGAGGSEAPGQQAGLRCVAAECGQALEFRWPLQRDRAAAGPRA